MNNDELLNAITERMDNRFKEVRDTHKDLYGLQRDTHAKLTDHITSSGIRDANQQGAIDAAHRKADDAAERAEEANAKAEAAAKSAKAAAGLSKKLIATLSASVAAAGAAIAEFLKHLISSGDHPKPH